MTSRQLLGVLLGTALLAVAAAFATVGYFSPDEDASPTGVAARSNIVLISVDTLRPDHLSLYGYPRRTTPFLDEFFAEGEIWENVYATEASTAPSVASILTGRLPQSHGVRLFYQRLGSEVPTLADLLSEQGYETAAIVSNVVLTAEAMGLNERFDHYDDFVDEREGARPVWERRASRTTDAALTWLASRESHTKPHLLWVHYIDPHGPYRAPQDKPLEFSHEGREEINILRIPRYTRLAEDPRDALRYIDRYDEEIAYTDREIGRLLEAYRQADDINDTIFIFTSDHGESMTDASIAFSHGFAALEPVMRVPLAVRRPGGRAKRRQAPVSTADIAPSILTWLGVPLPEGIDGFVLGQRPADAPVSLEATSHKGQTRAAIAGREKWMVRRNAKGEIVHRATKNLPIIRASDPERQTAEPPDGPWREGAISQVLDEWMDADDFPQNVATRTNPGSRIRAPKVAPGRSEREIEGLRALGYVE